MSNPPAAWFCSRVDKPVDRDLKADCRQARDEPVERRADERSGSAMKLVKYFGDSLHTESVRNEADWLAIHRDESIPNMSLWLK